MVADGEDDVESLVRKVTAPPAWWPVCRSHEFEKPATTGLVFFVGAQVIGQLLDAPRQDGDLDLGRAGIAVMAVVLCDEPGLDFLL
jgi:hypothetical protein